MQLPYEADQKKLVCVSWPNDLSELVLVCLYLCFVFAFTFMCAFDFVCVIVLPIQEWICVCRANYLSKLMLVHSIEALKREELSLRQDSNDDDNDGGGGGNVDVG